jgi:uncharacterized protein YyaL (SSP411 family)
LARRSARVRPGLDDKVLLAWNALFVRVLAESAVAFERDDWLDAARRNMRFLLTSMRRDDGRLLRSWQNGTAQHLAYAEDYAALLEAVITLGEVDSPRWLDDARTIADDLLALFEDAEHGGFVTSAADADPLIVRAKDLQDNATPSANSLAAHALLRLASLTGDDHYEHSARRVVDALAGVASQHPTAFAYLLAAVERATIPTIEVAVVGDPSDPRTRQLRHELRSRFLPNSVTLTADPGDTTETPLLHERTAHSDRPTAYVCEHFVCRVPATEPVTLREQLDAALDARRTTRA